MEHQTPLRIVLAKVGLDGHDRGVKVVTRALRDAGFHVIYPGLWQSPEAVVRTVADEDADWLGISLLSGTHMTLVPRILRAAARRPDLKHVGVLVGGIIPEADVPKLLALGVARVFGPGTPLPEIVEFLRAEGAARMLDDLLVAVLRARSAGAGPAADAGRPRRAARRHPRRHCCPRRPDARSWSPSPATPAWARAR